jgi:hypothetical protein
MRYREAFLPWGLRSSEFPDLKQITEFSVLLKHKPVDQLPCVASILPRHPLR